MRTHQLFFEENGFHKAPGACQTVFVADEHSFLEETCKNAEAVLNEL
jgi:hypothetical protein